MVHRALNSFDILLEIFENLRQHPFIYRDETGALAQAARVCRSFSEPALRVLWRTLDDLNPVYQLVITLEIFNNWHKNTTGEGFSALLSPEIPQQTWARFQQYASYVRTVRGIVDQSNSSLWIALSSRIGNQPLFPCLRSIGLPLNDSSCTNMLCLMAPWIDSLTMIYAESCGARSLEAFLNAVSTISPNAVWTLRTSSIALFRHTDFSRFSALRKVEVGFSTDAPDLFQKLSCLDYLNDLVINHWDGVARQIGRGRFVALQNIDLRFMKDHLLDIFTDFSFPQLQSARIAIKDPSNIATSRRILDALCSGSPSLCVLTLDCEQRGATEHALMTLLEPLLALSGMKVLDIAAATPHLSVSKDDIRTMAQSWPELRKLVIHCGCVDPAPPIQSIVEFANHCPHLQELHLPRFICVSRTFPITSTPSLRCKRWLDLRRLDIDVNDVELCQKAAEFIEGIFPSEEHWENTTVHNAGWQTVVSLINKRRASRKSLTGLA